MSLPAAPDWRRLLALYWITSFIEGLGVAQIYAFLPNRLAEVGVSGPDIAPFVGWLGSLFFLSGLPFIPLWGVWADKYSRKAVIIRSALVEAVVFGVIAASAAPWQLSRPVCGRSSSRLRPCWQAASWSRLRSPANPGAAPSPLRPAAAAS